MVPRVAAASLRSLAKWAPVVVVTGPRQSGKSTLCRMTFPSRPNVSLEPLDVREAVRTDPRGFLSEHQKKGVIVDEVQHVPELLSYLQDEVDKNGKPGRFILTGSQQFGLTQAVSQSLAGRAAMLELLPPSLSELRAFAGFRENLWDVIVRGSYPRIYDRKLQAREWLADYISTYVERDVRQVLRVGDLRTFASFLRLAAGRTAQELNLSTLGADAGVNHNTARAWMSVLRASYVCFELPAWHTNVRKQLIKAPKVHFFDTGVVCYLLGIRSATELKTHPLRGAIFETWCVSELYKSFVHRRKRPRFFHYRDAKGLEVDLVSDEGARVRLFEMKSGATIAGDFFAGVDRLQALLETKSGVVRTHVVYGGSTTSTRRTARVVPWNMLEPR